MNENTYENAGCEVAPREDASSTRQPEPAAPSQEPQAPTDRTEGTQKGESPEGKGGQDPAYMSPTEETRSAQKRPEESEKAETGRGRKRKRQAGDRKPVTSRAYIQTRQKVSSAACAFIDSLLRDYDDQTAHLFKHVLSSGCLWIYDNREVPVPSKLMRRKLRGDRKNGRDGMPDIDGLISAGLFDPTTGYTVGKQSRRYRVCDEVQAEYDRLTALNPDGPWVNLYTGKRDRSYTKSQTKDADGRAVPSLLRSAMRAIEHNGVANIKQGRSQLAQMDEEARRLRDVEIVTLAESGRDSEAHRTADELAARAEARYRNDLHCLQAITSNKTGDVGNGVISYRVPYRATMSGRLAFIGGGAQSCSREMKAALYDSVSEATGRTLHNYDIKSSQPTILRVKLVEADLSTEWIDTYVRKEKSEYADRAGLSVPTWKRILCAVLMSALLPLLANAQTSQGDVVKYVRADVGDHAFLSTYSATRAVLEDLYGVIQDWHTYLTTDWLCENGYQSGGREYVKNATGTRFDVTAATGRGQPPYTFRARLAAFVLQGQEAYFIHTLTGLSERYGFTVVANEHDGLVTLGEIPDEAIREAQEMCEMPYALLIPKPFL